MLSTKRGTNTQCNLGWLYQSGRGVPKSDEEAAKWYRLSADQGNMNGQLRLGMLYEKSLGVEQSYGKALALYRLSAAQGNDDVQCLRAMMYEDGKGVEKSYSEAAKWYRLSGSMETITRSSSSAGCTRRAWVWSSRTSRPRGGI